MTRFINNFVKDFAKPLKLDYQDNYLSEIYDKFINFMQNSLNVEKITEAEAKFNQDALNNISSEEEFFSFSQNSYGIYYKVCFWIKENFNFKLIENKKNRVNQHHIVCVYMQKYQPNILPLINRNYNLVSVTETLHVFLHAIRFIEYNSFDDLYYLSFVKPELYGFETFKSETGRLEFKFKQELKHQDGTDLLTIKAYVMQKLLDNPEYFYVPGVLKELKIVAGQKGGKQNAINNINPVINGYLNNEMHWKYESDEKIWLYFQPNQFDILRKLVIALNQKVPSNDWPQGWQTNNDFLSICGTQMKDYLLATPKMDQRNGNFFYSKLYKGWLLSEANSNCYRLKNIEIIGAKPKKIVSRQSDRVNHLLSKTNTLWYNVRYPIDQIIVDKGEFLLLVSLARRLLDLLPKNSRPSNYDNFETNNRVRNNMVYELSSLINYKNPRISTWYGWRYDIIDTKTS